LRRRAEGGDGLAMEDEDLYNTLGVDREATDAELKHAFRRLSLAYHPDRWQDERDKREVKQRFLRVSRAYTVLSDSSKRMAYDE
jgi:DnaJ-class molecular chaperone